MIRNKNLTKAKKAKNDEFYTQYHDIQKEIQAYLDFNPDVFRGKTILLPCDDPEWSNFTRYFAQNFERFGLKKLISTSYAAESKNIKFPYTPTPFETQSPHFDKAKTATNGKIFILETNTSLKGHTNLAHLQWGYLQGDGDFRSPEVKALRDEADFIITNPPFSLFREFLAWITEADKKFVIIANMNAITYKDSFKQIQQNKLWLGASGCTARTYKTLSGQDFKMGNTTWFTNVDHGKRHQPLKLMTMADNLKFSRHKEIKEKGYQKYDNYDAIEVPFTDAIPSDYDGVMGVPISFLDKYCPEQFEIIWTTDRGGDGYLNQYKKTHTRYDAPVLEGKGIYKRIIIKRKTL